ncbi:hypothetical protein AURDEDRAFT_159096 [Auricularia subglabra TFB-10046 SS5]|nr:hypothetical protein AURDEDRAFT_159096 [Auricularia subglabra TFB-10046 SS5]
MPPERSALEAYGGHGLCSTFYSGFFTQAGRTTKSTFCPWNPSRFLRILRENDFDAEQRQMLASIQPESSARELFAKVLNKGSDVMHAFAIHRDMFKVAISWFQIVYEEPRCGFPFDAWEDTLLHCAGILRGTPFPQLKPFTLDTFCRCPDDLADVLQIQYHLVLDQKSEAEALVASARARNSEEDWFLYAWSEMSSDGAFAALDCLWSTTNQETELLDPSHPIVDRILRNCFQGVYLDALYSMGTATQHTPSFVLGRIRKLTEAIRTQVSIRWQPADSPDAGWLLTVTTSCLYAPVSVRLVP